MWTRVLKEYNFGTSLSHCEDEARNQTTWIYILEVIGPTKPTLSGIRDGDR